VSNAELALRCRNRTRRRDATSPIKGTVVSVGVSPGDQVTAATNAFSVLTQS
jgi:biotin carboxyl carrier protein